MDRTAGRLEHACCAQAEAQAAREAKEEEDARLAALAAAKKAKKGKKGSKSRPKSPKPSAPAKTASTPAAKPTATAAASKQNAQTGKLASNTKAAPAEDRVKLSGNEKTPQAKGNLYVQNSPSKTDSRRSLLSPKRCRFKGWGKQDWAKQSWPQRIKSGPSPVGISREELTATGEAPATEPSDAANSGILCTAI